MFTTKTKGAVIALHIQTVQDEFLEKFAEDTTKAHHESMQSTSSKAICDTKAALAIKTQTGVDRFPNVRETGNHPL